MQQEYLVMNKFLVSAAAVALVLVCRVTPADANPPSKGGSFSMPKGGTLIAPKGGAFIAPKGGTLFAPKGGTLVSPKIVGLPGNGLGNKTLVSPAYVKYQKSWCKSPCGTIFGNGFCFPVGYCPAYTQCYYSLYWG